MRCLFCEELEVIMKKMLVVAGVLAVITACNKLKTYCYNGIFPSMQLITTYETSKCPISTDQVQQIITQYFL